MQQLLVDELTGDHVILAPARALRPDTFRANASPLPATVPSCPFCANNESETPPEVARIGPGAPDTPGWRVRVVPNKFPIVGDGVDGAHEVIVLSPAHDADLGRLPVAAATEALTAMRNRARVHLEGGCAHAQLFVNNGKASGASIEHPHAQLVALDIVPPRVQRRIERFTFDAFAADREHAVRDDDALIWCPRASTTPYATRVSLRDAGARFDQATDEQLAAVADALHDLLGRVHALLGDVAYNLVFETAPPSRPGPFQWWIDCVPRMSVYGGFEIGTGCWVNIVAPEAAATALRAAE
jgi:UDPglucose--hexose-1-phosphate uridylyltransferase